MTKCCDQYLAAGRPITQSRRRHAAALIGASGWPAWTMERRRGGHRQSLVHYQELSTSHNPSTHNIQIIVSAFSFGNCRNWNNFMTVFE